MSVTVTFRCSGCDAVAEGTAPIRWEFRSISGRNHGIIGSVIQANTIESVTPEGWWAHDPWTYATYCPECKQRLLEENDR